MEGIEAIWYKFGKQINEIVCYKSNHKDYCHDIQQDVYIRIMQNIDKIEKAGNIKSYILKMANNAVVDYYRKESTTQTDCITENFTFPEEVNFDNTSLRLADCCLRPMIESLDPIYREALIMVELEGTSQKEYAEKVGISYTNAKTRVQRARQKLKEVILNCCTYEFDKYGNIIAASKNSGKCCNP